MGGRDATVVAHMHPSVTKMPDRENIEITNYSDRWTTTTQHTEKFNERGHAVLI